MTMVNISHLLSVCVLLLSLMKYCCRPHGDENGVTETVNLHITLALCCFLYPMYNKQCYMQTKGELESLTCRRCETLKENIGDDFMRCKWNLGNAGNNTVLCKKEKTSSPVMTAVLFIILCFMFLSVKYLLNEKSTCLDNTLFELQNTVSSDQTCDSRLAYKKERAKNYDQKLFPISSAVFWKTFLSSPKNCVSSVLKSMYGCLEGNQDHLLYFRRTQIFQHSFIAAPAVGLLSQFVQSTDGHHDFCKEGVRLASYKTFPQTVAVSTFRLAQAGFYYSGEEDRVVCFSCGVTHSKWQTGDRPRIIHARKAPLCPFVNGTDTRNETLPLSMTIIPDFSESSPPNSLDSGCVSFASETSAMGGGESSVSSEIAEGNNASGPTVMVGTTPGTSITLTLPQASTYQTHSAGPGRDCGELNSQELPTKNLDLGCAVYPLYSQMDARRRSYHTWQHRHGLPPIDELISLGFFYAGYADCVRCFFCGIGLKSWEPEDDPAQVHASWRPTCQYLRLVKGDSFVDRLATGQSGATSSEQTQAQNQASNTRSNGDSGLAVQESSTALPLEQGETQRGSIEDRRPQEVEETDATRAARESGYTVAQIIAAIQELRNMGLEQQLESLLMDVLFNMFSNTTQQTTSVNRETDEIDGHQNFHDENRVVEDDTLSESGLQQDGRENDE